MTRRPHGDPTEHPDEPGAYIANRPERPAETIPGGVGEEDERVAAHSTQRGPVRDDREPTSKRPQGRTGSGSGD